MIYLHCQQGFSAEIGLVQRKMLKLDQRGKCKKRYFCTCLSLRSGQITSILIKFPLLWQ